MSMSTTKLIAEEIKAKYDDHIWITITNLENQPTISLDIENSHGRRVLGVRVNGTVVASILLDEFPSMTLPANLKRYCPYCGEEINHECKNV